MDIKQISILNINYLIYVNRRNSLSFGLNPLVLLGLGTSVKIGWESLFICRYVRLCIPEAPHTRGSRHLKVLPEVAVVFTGCSCTDTRTYKQKGSPTQYKFFLPSVLQTQLHNTTATSGSTFSNTILLIINRHG